MPIYAYRCGACGHAQDVLQKISDPVLTTCPACGAEAYVKQVTAAGFQLKGSGWYVTDFRGNGNAPAKKPDDAGSAGSAASDAAAAKADTAPGTKTDAPAGAPAPAASAPAEPARPAAAKAETGSKPPSAA
jgi:putative FmdB family regulatory protein